MLKSLMLVATQRLVASLSPGDCAFVGIYGEQDDFAFVLLEDAEGDELSVTEELPSQRRFEVQKAYAAKEHVRDTLRGSVLRRSDFQADSSALVAPTALTVFKGSPEEPVALCSIDMGKSGTAMRKLQEEVNMVTLGLTETAEYSGSTSGSKSQLMKDITDPLNWHQGSSLAGFRKLFSIASGNMTHTMTTTMTIAETITTTETMTVTSTNVTLNDLNTEASDVVGTSIFCGLLLGVGHLL